LPSRFADGEEVDQVDPAFARNIPGDLGVHGMKLRLAETQGPSAAGAELRLLWGACQRSIPLIVHLRGVEDVPEFGERGHRSLAHDEGCFGGIGILAVG
jgi:hypothetical protein